MQIELTGLEIKTKDGSTRISIDEAKELYRQLHELFGEKVIHVPSTPIVVDRWPVYPSSPIYVKDTPDTSRPSWMPPEIICHGIAATSSSNPSGEVRR